MKMACLSIATVIAVMPIASAQPSQQTTTVASPSSIALSAVRKKVQRKLYTVDLRSPYYRRPGVAPSFGYVGPPGYAGEYAWRRSIGQCVEDLGYGRWAACGNR